MAIVIIATIIIIIVRVLMKGRRDPNPTPHKDRSQKRIGVPSHDSERDPELVAVLSILDEKLPTNLCRRTEMYEVAAFLLKALVGRYYSDLGDQTCNTVGEFHKEASTELNYNQEARNGYRRMASSLVRTGELQRASGILDEVADKFSEVKVLRNKGVEFAGDNRQKLFDPLNDSSMTSEEAIRMAATAAELLLSECTEFVRASRACSDRAFELLRAKLQNVADDENCKRPDKDQDGGLF